MNKKAFAVCAGAFLGILMLGVAVAGINPANPGLPGVDTSLTGNDNNFYASLGTVTSNKGSVLCVACHTRNPAARTQYRVNKGGWNYVGSHFVTRNFADTAKGGGYTDGTSPKNVRRTTNNYIGDNVGQQNPGLMTVANGWYAMPQYGRLTAGVIDNNWPAGVAIGANAAQMICESCHNIVNNIGPNKLIATGFANGATTTGAGLDTKGTTTPVLCFGCHGAMDSGVNAEWQYHPVATGVTWVGTQHHRNSQGATGTGRYFGSATPLAGHNMGQMDPAYYTATQQMWAAGPGSLTAARALQWTGSRMKAVADNNQILSTTGGSQLLCTNCHRAHNTDSSVGATILMRGDLAISATTLIGLEPVPTSATNAYTGLTRMADQGGRGAAFNSTNSLCLTCHQ